MFLFHPAIPCILHICYLQSGWNLWRGGVCCLFNPVKTPPLWTKPPCLWCLGKTGAGETTSTKPLDIVLNGENKAEPDRAHCGVNLGSSQILHWWTEILSWNIILLLYSSKWRIIVTRFHIPDIWQKQRCCECPQMRQLQNVFFCAHGIHHCKKKFEVFFKYFISESWLNYSLIIDWTRACWWNNLWIMKGFSSRCFT